MRVAILPPLFHRRPVAETPIIFYLIKKVFRHAAMCEHQFRASAWCGGQRNGRHGVDALGEILSTPCLDKASSRNEIDVHSGDLTGVRRKLTPDTVAHESFAAGDFRALARVGKQVIDHLRWNFETNFMLDGFAHSRRLFVSLPQSARLEFFSLI